MWGGMRANECADRWKDLGLDELMKKGPSAQGQKKGTGMYLPR